jgi:uncharacterized membrane protein (UPF0127 family)
LNARRLSIKATRHFPGGGAAVVVVLAILASLLASRPVVAEDGVFEPLSIIANGRTHEFMVEVMRTDEEHARGMMFRRSLAPDKGMLFEFKAEKVASFWMQNTYVPLDMVFIRSDGTIHRIEKQAEPLSTRSISSGVPVIAVLELLGGTADRLGLGPGDRVEHALFAKP